MQSLKELLRPKTFNAISYVAVFSWIIVGVILLAIFADMEKSDTFRCEAKLEKIDLARAKCLEQYKRQYNKHAFPVTAFVSLNFFLIAIVGGIYSQVVKSRVDQLLAANRKRDAEGQNDNPPSEKRRLFVAYLCQLATRFAMAISVFIVLQTHVLYPANYPSDFLCQIAGGSHAAKASSTSNIQNSTMYECHNQQAAKETFWIHAVSVVNGAFALIILIEIICILSRARKGKKFLEDSQFLADHLPPREEKDSLHQVELQVLLPHENAQEYEDQELQQQGVDSQTSENEELQQQEDSHSTSEDQDPGQLPSKISTLIKSLKESIRDFTERPRELEAPFQKEHGDPTRNEDLNIDSIYTGLLLTTNMAQYDFSGDREQQLKVFPKPKGNSSLKAREDVVDVKNEKVLIVGRPGIGKTLFCTKFLREWAFNKPLFNAKLHFDFALLLKFRKFNSIKQLSLRELLSQAEFSPPEHLNDEVLSYILENPDKLLILFDGLDESASISSFRDEQPPCMSRETQMPLSALLYNIVKGHLLRGATVLTTTRPTTVSDIKHFPFRRTFEILGFSSKQIEEYVNNFTKNAAVKNDTGENLIWQHISTNMNIFTLCYIPVNLFIVCSCLLEVLNYKTPSTGVGLPEKLTHIYQIATKLFFFRHNEKYRDKRLCGKDIGSKDWPPEFKPLANIAFDGIKRRKFVFDANEVSNEIIQSALFHRLPDLQIDSFEYEAQFCFLHLTIQEFLAAKHVVDTMEEAQLRGFVTDHISKGEWQIVMQFLAGLLGDGDKPSIDVFTERLPKTTVKEDGSKLMEDYMGDDSVERNTFTCWPTGSEKQKAVTLMKCIYESNESVSVVQSKLEEIGINAVDFSHCRLEPADCTAVVHVLKACQQISLIKLSANNIGSLGCVEIVKLFANGNCKLRGLDLRFNNITEDGVKHLSNALENENCKLSSLDLAYNNITDEGVKQLSKALVNNCTLSSLNLGYNNITDEGVKQLSNALVNNCKLRSLNLAGNKITDESVKQLSKALVNDYCKLSSLNLAANNITDKGVRQLCKAVVNNNCKLSSLNLRATDITDEGVKQLTNALVNSNKLHCLDLSEHFNITNEAKNQIKQANPNCKVII